MCFKFRVSHSGVLFAFGLINDRFKINSRRVYLSGSSGGARVAGLVAVGYLEIFRGDIYIGGADTWEGDLADAVRPLFFHLYVVIFVVSPPP